MRFLLLVPTELQLIIINEITKPLVNVNVTYIDPNQMTEASAMTRTSASCRDPTSPPFRH
jgi:hypothetical protein